MSITINHSDACKILHEEFERTSSEPEDDLEAQWRIRVKRLSELCPYRKSATFIAALGTAILAKSVNSKVDVFCILERDGGDTSYSARSLADKVWAKERAYLEINLGANRANPLNNVPFIGRARIDGIENVRNKEGYEYLCECLNALSEIKQEVLARTVLRAFIASQKETDVRTFEVGKEAGDYLVIQSLSEIIDRFVCIDSEDGRRAQASAAGLLVTAFGKENIEVGHVNDPDRNFPLDIGVYNSAEEGSFHSAIEVKDKKIEGSDLLASIDKACEMKIFNVLYLAIAKTQTPFNLEREYVYARNKGCRLIVFFCWQEFCKACFAVSDVVGASAFGFAYRAIGEQLIELGVSQEGIDLWAEWQSEAK
ncbi:restriction endonuclease, Sac I superfamily [Syntrophotalea carbinolica DSM 2380]|uniref:Restriction endonuclease, Sac I superfamily n=1 Tax=Syntrophotalea carbinolica (strain DSM 2380 / NBRC 103641 / GraBd1) TaxID=338963 RepID=Q3A7G6_SYNC1|nr:restriction endonuclease, SacI family [Syntrophotalea carbinolica]ABA87678.1 restriction endonuclease, Sac I superfamily [Syntrophotalea carbinolica DSM 2380]